MEFGLFYAPEKDVERMQLSVVVRRENLELLDKLTGEHGLSRDDMVSAITDVCIHRFDRLMQEQKKLFEEDSDE